MRIRHKNPYINVSYTGEKMGKKPTLIRFPAFKKITIWAVRKWGHVIISEKEKHKINISQM